MTDDELWEAFWAGFMASGETYNGGWQQLGSHDFEAAVRADFRVWRCGEHEYTAWENVSAEMRDDKYVRECRHCPRVQTRWGHDEDAPILSGTRTPSEGDS